LLWNAHPEYGELPLAGAESLDLIFFLAATVSIGLFYLAVDRKNLGSRIVELWGLMILGLGLCWHVSQAVFDGLGGRVKVFERTPKSAQAAGSRRPTLAEWVYFVYLVLTGIGACLGSGIASMPLLVMMALGLGWSLWPGSGARQVEKTDPVALDELAQLSLDP
ncbi:MAG: hypothetical protein AAEJ04_00190, partial [Planctomycetota bacterium]